jgi:O-antigen/teichoic acid export membrane protein
VGGGAVVALAGGALSFLLSLGWQVVIARNLGPAGAGVFFLALSISKLLAEGGDLGVDYGILRLGGIAHGSSDANRFRALVFSGLRGSLVFGTIAGLALAAGASLVAAALDTPEMTAALVALSLAVPFTASSEVVRSGLRALGDATRPTVSTSIVTPILRLATGAWAVWTLGSPEAVAWAYFVTEVLVFVVTEIMLLRIMPAGDRHASDAVGLFRFSLPMSLNRLLLYGNNQTEVVILKVLNAPIAIVGIFAIARRLSVLIGSLLTSVTVLFNPVVADLHETNRTQELDHLYKTSTRWLLTLGLPICLVELLFADEVLAVMGKGFQQGTTALIILAIGQLVNVGTGVTSNLQAMAGYAKVTLLNSLLFLSMSIVLDFTLIPTMGLLIGAATAAATSTIVVNVLRLWQIYRRLGLLPYDRTFVRPLAAAVPASLAAVLLPLPAISVEIDLLIRIMVLGVVYLGALFLMGFEPIDREIGRAAVGKVMGRRGAALATEKTAP